METVARDIVSRCERLFPPDDELTLNAKYLLAYVLLRVEKQSEAEELAKKLKENLKQAFGEYDHKTINMKRIYAQAMIEQNKYYLG